jgi:hypothetical protein
MTRTAGSVYLSGFGPQAAKEVECGRVRGRLAADWVFPKALIMHALLFIMQLTTSCFEGAPGSEGLYSW